MAEWREEDWELYNDGVLIYRRKKRRFAVSQPPPPPPPSSSSEPQPDPEVEEKNRRARKRRALIKLKDKYQKELDQWDNLSNTLHALEERAQQQQTLRLQEQEQEREEEEQALSAASPSGSSLVQRSMVDELLLKVEAEESIIHDVSNLCDISEALCDAQEEQLNQSLFDLPIWGSPRTLMASLCDGLED